MILVNNTSGAFLDNIIIFFCVSYGGGNAFRPRTTHLFRVSLCAFVCTGARVCMRVCMHVCVCVCGLDSLIGSATQSFSKGCTKMYLPAPLCIPDSCVCAP